MGEPEKHEQIWSMRTRVAVLAALFTYVLFIPVTTAGEFASALTTALGVGVIVYTGLKGMLDAGS